MTQLRQRIRWVSSQSCRQLFVKATLYGDFLCFCAFPWMIYSAWHNPLWFQNAFSCAPVELWMDRALLKLQSRTKLLTHPPSPHSMLVECRVRSKSLSRPPDENQHWKGEGGGEKSRFSTCGGNMVGVIDDNLQNVKLQRVYKWQFIFFPHGLTQTNRLLREPQGVSGLCINHSWYVTSLMFN